MKRVLIISAVFPPEPVVSASISNDLAYQLSNNHKVTVFCPRPSRPFGFRFLEKESEYRPFNLVRSNSYTCAQSNVIGRMWESISFGLSCYRYIKNNRCNFDIIYMNSWPIFSQYLAVKQANRFNIPVTSHIQDIYPESLSNKIPMLTPVFNFLFKPIDKFVLGGSERIIVISKSMKNYLSNSRNIPMDKFRVLANWQDESLFKITSNSIKVDTRENSLFTFMYLGNLGPLAGIDFLIDSFKKSELLNSKLIIAGSGSKRIELQNYVLLNNIERVYFVDVPEGSVAEVQKNADVMLLPMKGGTGHSSVPSKLPAYMFSKKPIIASIDKESATACAIIEAKAGWVVHPENISLLAQTMKKVYSMPKLELQLKGENGYNFAINNFSKRKNLGKLVNILIHEV